MSTKKELDLQLQRQGDDRSLVAELTIEAPPERVWQAISEGEEIANWFALQAATRPGLGGSIWLSWDGHFEATMKIEEWEPGNRLRHTWPVTDPEGRSVELAVEYRLEGRGGHTLLRLVHSGFSGASDWDDIVDSHRRGWQVELQSLRHYVEHHAGRRRGLVKVEAPIGTSRAEAWERLWSSGGFLVDGDLSDARAGHRFEMTLRPDTRVEGKVLAIEPPTDLALIVDNHERAMLRVSIEPWSLDDTLKVRVWLFSWTMSDEQRDRLQSTWQRELDRLFPPAAVAAAN